MRTRVDSFGGLEGECRRREAGESSSARTTAERQSRRVKVGRPRERWCERDKAAVRAGGRESERVRNGGWRWSGVKREGKSQRRSIPRHASRHHLFRRSEASFIQPFRLSVKNGTSMLYISRLYRVALLFQSSPRFDRGNGTETKVSHSSSAFFVHGSDA